MKVTALLLVLGIAILEVAGCGKKSEEGGGGTAAPPADVPPIDCARFAEKFGTCTEDYLKAFEATEQAKSTGGGDGAKGAGVWRNLLTNPPGAAATCTEQWGQKDPRWNKRFNDCWSKEDCAGWGACMADATGNLLPVPQ